MKQFFLSILLLCMIPMVSKAQLPPLFTTYSMGGVNPEFTTNNFKCIAVGKGNRIWAGTQYGGLYTFDPPFDVNTWRKSSRLDSLSINDIKIDGDSGIWIAQSGRQQTQGGNSNIAGGLNYFRVQSDLSMEFYSVLGTTTSGALVSRNARSVYLDRSYNSGNGRLPRPWLAQGTFISSFTTKRGGLNIGLLANPPYLLNYASGYQTGATATPISEAVGGDGREVWVAARLNNGGSQILRYNPTSEYIGTYGTADTSLFQAGFAAQAIHFDAKGNRWIGLKSGGLIIKNGEGWLKMDAPSLIPPGTQVNFNAITSDEFGNVFIGTSNGLLQYLCRDYNPGSSPDYTPSYRYYTTNDGLPSNNITGLAYDSKYGNVLITSDAGVTFMKNREEYIKGVVFDVFCNLDGPKTYSGLQQKPLTLGVTTIRLIKDGVEEEVTQPDANGIFELKEANDDDTYTVEIKSEIEGNIIKYIYNGVRNHTRLLPALVPDGLIREIKALKPKLIKRCFPLKLPLGFEVENFICTPSDDPAAGPDYDMRYFDDPYLEFYAPQGLTEHKKRVDNLATYYTALVTVYNIGGNAADLVTDVVANVFDAIDAIKGMAEFTDAVKNTPNIDDALVYNEQIAKGEAAVLNAFKNTIVFSLSKLSLLLDDESKKIVDRCVGAVNEVADLLIEARQNGSGAAFKKGVMDNLKKVVAQIVSLLYYRNIYAQERHLLTVPSAAISAKNMESESDYAVNFDNLYSPTSSSVTKEAKDSYDESKKNIEILGDIAKVADIASSVTDAISVISLIGGPPAAAAVKIVSYTAKGVKIGAFAGSIYNGAAGAHEIAVLSSTAETRAGFHRPLPGSSNTITSTAQAAPDSLIARKNRYNVRLTELQGIYTAAVYDSIAYKNKLNQLLQDDSLYSAALSNTIYSLYASIDTAAARIPGFTNRFDRVIDSFVMLQYALRHSLHYQNISFIFDPNKTVYAPGLDSTANQLKLANDSAVNGIASLITSINNNGVGALAYLVQEKYTINFSRIPGTAGTVTYTFKNYGGETQNNVSFKISRPTAGYTITSADSVNVGNILAGESKNVSFNFQSPANDSTGDYLITVKAANGIVKPVTGLLYAIDPTKFYSIKNGNWNDPATWSANAVPSAINKVYIAHKVTVTADASCKGVTVYKPGNVIVNSGKRIIINN